MLPDTLLNLGFKQVRKDHYQCQMKWMSKCRIQNRTLETHNETEWRLKLTRRIRIKEGMRHKTKHISKLKEYRNRWSTHYTSKDYNNNRIILIVIIYAM